MVKARALFRWLSVTDAGIDWSRFGTGFADPLLPVSMKSLEGGLKKCLEQRPPHEKTVPPRPASAGNAKWPGPCFATGWIEVRRSRFGQWSISSDSYARGGDVLVARNSG
jgi:hypothetical protein